MGMGRGGISSEAATVLKGLSYITSLWMLLTRSRSCDTPLSIATTTAKRGKMSGWLFPPLVCIGMVLLCLARACV